jgi:hypothetical protein
MLRNGIDKAAFDALPDVLKAEYKATGDNYTLQHDEDVGALKRAKDREKERADGLAVELSTEKNAHANTRKDATKEGTPLQIAEAAKLKALEEVKPKLERADRLETRLKTSALNQTASELAAKIGGDKNKVALLPHIEKRLDVSLDDNDEVKLVIKGADGKPTALKIDDLEKEVRGDKNLASLVVVSAANGGVSRPVQGVKQSPASSAGEKAPLLRDMNKADRVAYIQGKVAEQTQTA